MVLRATCSIRATLPPEKSDDQSVISVPRLRFRAVRTLGRRTATEDEGARIPATREMLSATKLTYDDLPNTLQLFEK